jgi:uncharacterized protein YndB with AHSA1/START domain
METPQKITVEATINAPVSKTWNLWNSPEHITKWYFASDDWHAPNAENDLRAGGNLKITMAAKDGSFQFDFEGIYTNVVENELIEYDIADGRKVKIIFTNKTGQTEIVETFEMEAQHPEELQRSGWQAILNSFKKYAEENT